MDSQTKNIVLFGIIFSVLAVSILGFIFLSSSNAPSSTVDQTPFSTTTETLDATEKKPRGLSFFDFSKFSSFFGGPASNTTMFNIAPNTNSNTTTNKPTSNTINSSEQPEEPEPNQTEVPYDKLVGIYGEYDSAESQVSLEFFANDLPSSPLRGKIWISRVTRSTDVNREYLTISTNKNLPPQTRLTGMTIKSVVSGKTVQIGEGVELPLVNSINDPRDIYINPEMKVIVTSGSSPTGYSFRLNLCTGYFEQFQNFTPVLPKQCPALKNAPLPAPPNQLSDKCIDDIQKFPRCEVLTEWPAIINDQHYDCLNFVDTYIGYQNCVDLNKNFSFFWNNEWRTYLNWSTPLWRTKREIIWLLDQEGRFISQYSY